MKTLLECQILEMQDKNPIDITRAETKQKRNNKKSHTFSGLPLLNYYNRSFGKLKKKMTDAKKKKKRHWPLNVTSTLFSHSYIWHYDNILSNIITSEDYFGRKNKRQEDATQNHTKYPIQLRALSECLMIMSLYLVHQKTLNG